VRARRGFTLIEVLGAVLVLAVLYTVLAEAAIGGLRTEGENRRRLEASLLADDMLMEIESGLLSGNVPQIGREESEDDLYLITLEVRAIDPSEFLPAQAFGERSIALDLLGGDGDESPLRAIEISVAWFEVEDERVVRRTTFAFDTGGLTGAEDSIDFDATASSGGYLESAQRRRARNQSRRFD
jgi:prepilin-type N-terminal cleavage/methylation domain-containing protein